MTKYKFTPFSKNIVFFDAEFSSLDPYKGELLSIGMVAMDGRELYLEPEHKGEVSEWVKENVLPSLKQKKISRRAACKKIEKFVGPDKPYLISYVIPFDAIYFYKLFGINDEQTNKGLAFNWIILDFASFLFANGFDPESGARHKGEFFKKLGIDDKKYQGHHALDDAKLLREVYLKMSVTGKTKD